MLELHLNHSYPVLIKCNEAIPGFFTLENKRPLEVRKEHLQRAKPQLSIGDSYDVQP
jgi:hypothetical protein